MGALEDFDDLMKRVALPGRSHKDGTEQLIESVRTALKDPVDEDEFGPIDYVASILYAYDCATREREPGRWWSVRPDIRNEFRRRAVETIASWSLEEITAMRLGSPGRLT